MPSTEAAEGWPIRPDNDIVPTRRREAGGATRTMGLFADGSVEAVQSDPAVREAFWQLPQVRALVAQA